MPKMLVQVHELLRQAPSVGPLDEPEWQVFESPHQPHEPRLVQLPQPLLDAHESPGVVHWLLTYAQLVHVP
jgi:hypothetical protein